MKTPLKPFLALGAGAIASAVLAVPAVAQVKSLLPFHKTGDILIGDSTNCVVLRGSDLTGDGTYNTLGEISLYFDPATAINASTGLPYGISLGKPAVITCDLQANVFIVGKVKTDSQEEAPRIFKLRDVNGDGDACDSGESSIYFDGTLSLQVPDAINGAAFDPAGTLWITVDRPSSDLVMTLTDLNADGDVNDGGEAVVVFDESQSGMALLNLAWAGFTPGGIFYMQNAATFHRFTMTLEDNSTPPNGVLHDSGDVTLIYQSLSGNPAQGTSKCARFGVDGRLYMYNTSVKHFVAAADVNGNGIYDNAGEGSQFFVNGDNGLFLGDGSIFDLRGDGAVLFADSGANAKLVVLQDSNGDGDARDAGESVIALDIVNSAFPTANPRAVFYLPQEPGLFGTGGLTSAGVPLTLRWQNETGLPIPGNTGFAVDLTQAPANVVVGLLYSDTLTAIPLDSLAPAVADPSVYLYTDLFSPDSGAIDPGLLTDGSGNARIPVPLPPSLSVLAGKSFCLQGLTVDWSLTLPVVLSNAVTFSIL